MPDGPAFETYFDAKTGEQHSKNGVKPSGYTPPRPFTATELQAMDLPEINFVVPGLFPEGLTILAGKPKIGKSLLVLALCVAVASGGYAMGTIKVEKGDVLYLALEDNPRRLKKRMKDLLGDQPWPEGLSFVNEWPRLDAKALAYIQIWLDEHPNARMVIIDTFVKVRPPRKSAAGYTEDYGDMEGLQALAGKNRLGVMVVHHARKQESEDAMDDVSGTLGLSGGSDGTWVMKQKSRAQREATISIVHRDIEENQEIALIWDGLLKTWKEVGTAAAMRLSKERQEIIDLLASAPRGMGPSAVAADLKKTSGTVRKLMADMLKDGHLVSLTYGVYMVPSIGAPVTLGNTSGNTSPRAKSDSGASGNTGNTGNSSPIQGAFVPETESPSVTGVSSRLGNSHPANGHETPSVTAVTAVTAPREIPSDEDDDEVLPF